MWHKMKTYLPRLIVVGVMLTIGYKSLMESNLLNFGSNNYTLQWTGNRGSKLFGSYVIGSRTANMPSKVKKVTAILPYQVNFSAPKNALISVAGVTVNQGKVEIKIFKNGLECKKEFVAEGAINSQVCR